MALPAASLPPLVMPRLRCGHSYSLCYSWTRATSAPQRMATEHAHKLECACMCLMPMEVEVWLAEADSECIYIVHHSSYWLPRWWMNITWVCGNSDNVGKLGGQDDRRRGRRSQDMQFSMVVLSQIKVESNRWLAILWCQMRWGTVLKAQTSKVLLRLMLQLS